MSKAPLDLISNRIRYESVAKMASEVSSASHLNDIEKALQRHSKFVVSAFQFVYCFILENQVVSFSFNKQFDLPLKQILNSYNSSLERPQIFSKQDDLDEISELLFQNEKVSSVIRVCNKSEQKNYLVHFASKDEVYNHNDAKFIKLIIELVLPKVQSILLTEKIQLQNDELKSANHKIDLVNKELTGSISYAQRIQSALLPSKETINEVLDQNFIIFKPRDVVSGDFYYSYKRDNKLVLVAADCTGHGVPGAMLSIFCIQLFREVCNSCPTLAANEILNALDEKFKEYLSDSYSKTQKVRMQDGMDVSVIDICFEEKKLQFASANRPLAFVRNGRLNRIRGSRFPIGSHATYANKDFEAHQINYQEGDRFYMFSDGYPDQFGGPRGKKLLTSRFLKMLEDSSSLSILEQEAYLEREWESWKQDQMQIDDILVMGFQL